MTIQAKIKDYMSIATDPENEVFIIFSIKTDYDDEKLGKTLEGVAYLSETLEPLIYNIRASHQQIVETTKIEIEDRSFCMRCFNGKITALFYIDEVDKYIA